MYKVYILLLLTIYNSTQSMDSLKWAPVKNNKVEGATHYFINPEYTIQTHGGIQPVTLYFGPLAMFYKYDQEKQSSEFLGVLGIKEKLTPEIIQSAISKLDKYIHAPNLSILLPAITKAIIEPSHDGEGNTIVLYDFQGGKVNICNRYDGPADIKEEQYNLQLPKPHAIFTNLKKVEKTIPNPQQYALTKLLYTSYTKEVIEYNGTLKTTMSILLNKDLKDEQTQH